MAVYYGRLEDISIKLLKTAKTTFKNVAQAMIVKVLFQFIFQSPITLIGDFYIGFKKSSPLTVSFNIRIYFTFIRADDKHSTISSTASSMFIVSSSFNIMGIR